MKSSIKVIETISSQCKYFERVKITWTIWRKMQCFDLCFNHLEVELKSKQSSIINQNLFCSAQQSLNLFYSIYYINIQILNKIIRVKGQQIFLQKKYRVSSLHKLSNDINNRKLKYHNIILYLNAQKYKNTMYTLNC